MLSCSPGASAGESSKGAEAPAGRCFAVPLSLALAQHNWFFSEKAVGRQRESGKVVLLQSDEGLGGLEALSRMAGRGWTGGALVSQCLGNEATQPLASEVSAGDNCPFSMLVARGRVMTLSWFLKPPHESFL